MNPDDIIGTLKDAIKRLGEKLDSLVNDFNNALKKIPGYLRWTVNKAVDLWNNEVVPKLNDLWQWINAHNIFGNPDQLEHLASEWRKDVGKPTSARAGMADAGQVTVDDNWTGSAADAYKERLSQQETAIKSIQSQFAEPIASALTKVANGIRVWLVGLIGAIATLILAILLASGEAVSVIGIPAVPATIIAAVAACLVSFSGGTAILYALSANAKGDLDGASSNLSAYPGGSWPAFG